MKFPTAIALLLAVLIGSYAAWIATIGLVPTSDPLMTVSAAPPSVAMTCSGVNFSAVVVKAALPAEVTLRLVQDGDMADRGGAFSVSDVVGPGEENIPTRRFALAGVSDRRIFVAVEHGGIGYGVEIWTFDRAEPPLHWHGVMSNVVRAPPASLRSLLPENCVES